MLKFSLSVRVPHVGATPLPGQHGVGCAVVYSREHAHGLALIADGAQGNSGASATNAMDAVLQQLTELAPAEIQWTRCAVVELDSMGDFDLVQVQWGPEGAVEACRFAPLLHPQTPPRSREAFQARFGEQAQLVLTELQKTGYGVVSAAV